MGITPFTLEDYNRLDEQQKNIIKELYEFAVGDQLIEPEDYCFEENLELFHNVQPNALPSNFLNEDWASNVYNKFWCVYRTAAKLAEQVEAFEPRVVVDPDMECYTQVVVLSYRYAHAHFLWAEEKVAYFHFKNLAELADFIFARRDEILKNMAEYHKSLVPF